MQGSSIGRRRGSQSTVQDLTKAAKIATQGLFEQSGSALGSILFCLAIPALALAAVVESDAPSERDHERQSTVDDNGGNIPSDVLQHGWVCF